MKPKLLALIVSFILVQPIFSTESTNSISNNEYIDRLYLKKVSLDDLKAMRSYVDLLESKPSLSQAAKEKIKSEVKSITDTFVTRSITFGLILAFLGGTQSIWHKVTPTSVKALINWGLIGTFVYLIGDLIYSLLSEPIKTDVFNSRLSDLRVMLDEQIMQLESERA
ncbi:MAG TPA: hypothetical protein VHA52_13250 [Candidatus Babeliaceae bacterium]|nr:hypothetical protein [Candidatus Babeliaceae bacterium]